MVAQIRRKLGGCRLNTWVTLQHSLAVERARRQLKDWLQLMEVPAEPILISGSLRYQVLAMSS
ncbi:MAG: hypothetical protein M3024_14695, partial [Candidatus Dormibacteraeota bacterium]|nr:hypothetical protein [Candidatus Dormibacteraeota bacterium]